MRGIRERLRDLPAEQRALGCAVFVFGVDTAIFLGLGSSIGSAIVTGLACGIGGAVGTLLTPARGRQVP